MEVSRLDKFNICRSFTLSNDDICCLNLLYLPIIKGEALSVYMAFNSLISRSSMETEFFSHTFMTDLLGISIESFNMARKVLEGIGLLTTLKNDEGYLYLLREPLSPKKFLNSNIHGLVLYSTVGEDIYNELRVRFRIKKINKNLYEDVSASFDEVFKPYIPNKILKEDDYLVEKDSGKSIEIKHYDFNFSQFASQIDDSFIPGGITESFKNYILATASNYSFDEADMVSLYKESIDSDGVFKENIFKKKAKVLFSFKTKEETPKFKIQDTVKIKDPDNEAIKAIEESTGEEFLSQIMGDKYDPKYLVTLNELNSSLQLNPSVIKLLVMYVLKIIQDKNGEIQFPAITYFKKAADDWILNGYTDIYSAYNFINGISTTTNTKKYTNYKKPVRKPGKYEQENKKKDIMEGMDVL